MDNKKNKIKEILYSIVFYVVFFGFIFLLIVADFFDTNITLLTMYHIRKSLAVILQISIVFVSIYLFIVGIKFLYNREKLFYRLCHIIKDLFCGLFYLYLESKIFQFIIGILILGIIAFSYPDSNSNTNAIYTKRENNIYVINKDSKKFHYNDCHSTEKILDKNREETTQSRDELIIKGYDPCGNCNP